jgi:hypothetical protein
LPVPVREANKYFGANVKYSEAFREAYENFYACGSNMEEIKSTSDLVESCLRLLPKKSPQAQDLAVKFYQLKAMYSDLENNSLWEKLAKSNNLKEQQKIISKITKREWEKEATRIWLMDEYGAQIPSYTKEFPETELGEA